tara:strand:- start:2853 stop:5219 length:2367 start_codon:yes stop_codon:yes gene_type:complete
MLAVRFLVGVAIALGSYTSLRAADLPLLEVEAQPMKAQARRVAAALQFLGQPLTQQQQQALDAAVAESDENQATNAIQKLFDSMALAMVHINPEQRVKVERGPAAAQLHQSGWTLFLVKVHNEPGINPQLNATSPNAVPVVRRSTGSKSPKQDVKPQDIADRWLDLMTFDQKPLTKTLTGLTVEYRILQLYSRDAGKREAKLSFNVGQGSQDLGFRNELNILFHCKPAVRVTLEVIDDDGQPTTGQFIFRDSNGRVYPARTRRLAPDFFFHDQIYRDSGETVLLPPGTFQVTYSRGPEYRILQRQITVPNAPTNQQTFRLKRWIKLADKGWFSGDHHVHAAGCSHYEAPTQGVDPAAMMRHIRGEDLNVGCVLTWGPCWYFQKDFFEGKVHALSTPNNLMRYDVEVSGFPSDHCGHLCLLRLSEDDYPGTKRVEDWPSWDLPILKWGKKQGGVVGFSHSGWGLQLPDYLPDGTRAFPSRRYGGSDSSWKGKAPATLPDYAMPRFDGIGANEYVVDVVHGVCDFISAVDTPITWELNVWYHTLNCGYTCRISGETDFPCIYGERVGLGRAYVKLGEEQELSYDNWVFALRDGRSYCSDGLSHLYDFQVNGLGVGERGDAGRPSFLAVKNNQKLTIGVNAAALLAETPRDDIRNRRLDVQPYWHVERARVADTRKVPVELIVNGQSVARQDLTADGSIQNLSFDYKLDRSSWVALRIFPSAHTNPIFVEVDGKPIRASKRSAKWCLEATETCWNSKKKGIRDTEQAAAVKAYDKAREAYSRILQESFDDE